jgi:hypothetical protein
MFLGVASILKIYQERHRRRASFRNERHLFKRKCEATGKPLISNFSMDFKGTVYSQDYWWSDKWSALDYGRDYDFNRPFFEQFSELMIAVPWIASVVTNSENCEYNSFCTASKNCYLSQRVGDSEEIYYSYLAIRSRNCVDCFNISDCESCYEVIDAKTCYNLMFSQNVTKCSDSKFLFNCRNCNSCFFCTNLRNASYCWNNQQLSKEEYENRIKQYAIFQFTSLNSLKAQFNQLVTTATVPAFWGGAVENVSGDYLYESRNVVESFDVIGAESIKYCRGFYYGKNCLDSDFTYYNDECHEFISGLHSSLLKFSFAIYHGCHDIEYSMYCANNSHDLFGCIGLRQSKYCILNKQYSQQDFVVLRNKIIEHMTQTSEWGEFFPAAISPFPYNHSVAYEYFPRSKQEVKSEGLVWYEEEILTDPASVFIPESIDKVGDEILKAVMQCNSSGKKFAIQKGELEFYRNHGLPIPRLCPDQRYNLRTQKRNPRRLYRRTCAASAEEILTSYAPNRSERVLSYDQYVKEVN